MKDFYLKFTYGENHVSYMAIVADSLAEAQKIADGFPVTFRKVEAVEGWGN